MNRRIHLFGTVKIGGVDAGPFLQGQTTADVITLQQGHTTCSAILTPKGRVLANFRLTLHPEGYFLLLPIDRLEFVVNRLRMYVLRSKVTIEAFRHPEGLCWHQSTPPYPEIHPTFMLGEGESLSPFRTMEDAADAIDADESFHLAEIRRGFAWVTQASQETYLPQMLNLDQWGGISYKKGCYTGQEIVTRTQFLGQLKRRLFRYVLEDHKALPIGTPLFLADGEREESIGAIVNSAQTDHGRSEYLAVVQIDKAAASIRANGPLGPTLSLCETHPIDPSNASE